MNIRDMFIICLNKLLQARLYRLIKVFKKRLLALGLFITNTISNYCHLNQLFTVLK